MPTTAVRPPGPRGLLPLREIRAFRHDLLGFLEQMPKTYGDIAYFRLGLQRLYLVSHPDYINLSRLYRGRLTNLTELPEHLTRLRQRHNVPGTCIDIQLRYR